MDWTIILIAVVAVAAVFWLKRAGQLPRDRVVELLRAGAPVIDVRTAEEYGRDAVPGAINIPLDRLSAELPVRYPDKGQALLLHCLSGGRSMMGARALRGLGYTNVHNLGSLSRARQLAGVPRHVDPDTTP